jgi:hypothetical protein
VTLHRRQGSEYQVTGNQPLAWLLNTSPADHLN